MEVTKKAVTTSEQLTLKTVDLYINTHLFSLAGDWEWNMHSEAIYCSDVIMALPPDYVGTKGIVHPDDLEKLKQQLLSFSTQEYIDIEFRMITTYNEVRNISGKNCKKIEVDELKLQSPVKELLVSTVSQIENETGLQNYHNIKQTTDFAEQLTKTATWYTNTYTHDTYYSDNVFRMHGLMPQSLNPHLHSFTHFIHPDDAGPFNDAFDTAYKNQVPIFLEYRILTANGREKFVSLTTKWAHNFKGELILSGLLNDLTDRRDIENKIEQSVNDVQFQKALLQFNEQAGNTGYWQVNLLTRQIYYSDNYYRIHGLKPQSVPAGANIFNNYIHPDDREKVIEAFKKIRKEHIAPDIEYCILRADGKIRHVVQKGQLISYGGELVMTGTIRDITQQKNLEQKLLEQKEEGLLKEIGYSESEQATGISSWVQDMQTGDIFWSDNMYGFLGFKKTVKELTFPQLLKTILPEHRKSFMDEIAVAIESGQREMECSILRNGAVHNVKAVFKTVMADNKRFFTATLQDITNHHLLQQQLFESAQLNQLLVENILDSVFITDINNKIILWNRKCEQFFDLKNEEVEERNYFDVFPQHKTEIIINRFNTVLKGEIIHERNERTKINEFHDLNMIPLRDRYSKVIGILHVLHDVTQELQLRNNLTERLHFIEKLMEETVDRIVVLDRNFNFTYWNQKAELHYHVNQEYVIGKNVLEIFPHIVNKPLYHHLKKALKGETVYIGSSKPEKRDSTYKTESILGEEGEYIETYLIPMLNTRNEVTSILWIVHDLSKDVQLQKKKQKRF